MHFFNELFEKSDLPNTGGTRKKFSHMLDENLYWEIIDASLKNSNNQDTQKKFLISKLETFNPLDMIGFKLRTDKLLYDTYTSEMWCAGYIMNGGYCSDDGFEYFRCWIISRGKDTYYRAKENPDFLINELDQTLELYEFENLWYVAHQTFENKTGENMWDFLDPNFDYNEWHYPGLLMNWDSDKPETMAAICPKLFDKLSKKNY